MTTDKLSAMRNKNYKLLMLGTHPELHTSTGFFTRELAKRLQQLPHIEFQLLTTNDLTIATRLPTADVCLVHATIPSLHTSLSLRQKSSFRLTASFLEVAVPGFDRCYTYLGRDSSVNKHVAAPAVNAYYQFPKKNPGTVLLDHSLYGFPDAGKLTHDWNEPLREWFKKYAYRYPLIAQLQGREPADQIPFASISTMDHQSYLQHTASFATFVVTHAGSYNHAAKDMAVRGSRVLVPKVPKIIDTSSRQLFVPDQLVELFGMIPFESVEQLGELLNSDWAAEPQMHKTTDMDDVVLMIDADIQSNL